MFLEPSTHGKHPGWHDGGYEVMIVGIHAFAGGDCLEIA
jgi:hypothetical protein